MVSPWPPQEHAFLAHVLTSVLASCEQALCTQLPKTHLGEQQHAHKCIWVALFEKVHAGIRKSYKKSPEINGDLFGSDYFTIIMWALHVIPSVSQRTIKIAQKLTLWPFTQGPGREEETVLFEHMESWLTILWIGKQRFVWTLSVSGVSTVKQFLFNKTTRCFCSQINQ